jgi:hypothetical protein
MDTAGTSADPNRPSCVGSTAPAARGEPARDGTTAYGHEDAGDEPATLSGNNGGDEREDSADWDGLSILGCGDRGFSCRGGSTGESAA